MRNGRETHLGFSDSQVFLQTSCNVHGHALEFPIVSAEPDDSSIQHTCIEPCSVYLSVCPQIYSLSFPILLCIAGMSVCVRVYEYVCVSV